MQQSAIEFAANKYNNIKTINYFNELSIIKNNAHVTDFALYTPINSIQRFLVRYELVKMIKDIPGAIIELGVFNGNGLQSLIHAHNILQPTNVYREFYGFDSFEGFPEVHENDKNENINWQKGDYHSNNTLDQLNSIIDAVIIIDIHNNYYYIKNNIKLIKGDINETVPTFIENNKHVIISLLYLDMDIYEPTKTALKHFLPRMMKGSIVAFDELNFKNFPGETVAALEELGTKYKFVNLLNSHINYCIIE